MRFLLGLLWCLHFLPLPILGRLGVVVGYLCYWLIPERRHITLTNLRLCFPAMTEEERTALAKRHFQAYGRALLERGILWWSSTKRISKLIQIDLKQAEDFTTADQILLLCPHFVSLEVAGIGIVFSTSIKKICSIYAPQKNKVFDQALKKGRSRFVPTRLLTRSEGVKPIIRAMRQGYAFLMLPDMDFGIKNAAFVPFFGVPAATLTAPARIAGLTHSKVIPVIATLLPNYQGWRVTAYPAWENFPGDDMVSATRRMNAFIEEQIHLALPEYLWSHRRFKTRPVGENQVYTHRKPRSVF